MDWWWNVGAALALAGGCVHSFAAAQSLDQAREDAVFLPHARLGVGMAPVVFDTAMLPNADHGVAVFAALLVELPYQLSVGASGEWERYRFDSANHGDDPFGAPRYEGEVLTHRRLLALLQYDVLPENFVNPYLFAGAGYVWEHSSLTDFQCRPKQVSGRVFAAGIGIEYPIVGPLRVGIEYRFASKPDATAACTLADIPSEPIGAPSDFSPMRLALTVAVRGPYF